MRGARWARSTVRVRAGALGAGVVLLGAACTGVAPSDPGAAAPASDATEATPAVPPSPVPPSPEPPSAEPEPPAMQRLARSLPGSSWDPDQPVRNTSFAPFDTLRHPEVGQTLEVEQAFELQRIAVGFEPPTVALPGFRERYFDGVDWGIVAPYTEILAPAASIDLTLSLVLYRSPDRDAFPTVARMAPGAQEVPSRVRDVIPVGELEVVSDQLLGGTVRTDGTSLLDLTVPVVLDAGRWLVALRIERFDEDLDVIGLPVVGLESASPPDVVLRPDLPCEFVQTPDPTPDHAFYFRTTFEDGLEVFTHGFGKVQGDCVVEGYYFSPAGTGDIGLDLFGVPVG